MEQGHFASPDQSSMLSQLASNPGMANLYGAGAAGGSDFGCSATAPRSESGFLPYSAAVLSKTAVSPPDQRDEAPLTR